MKTTVELPDELVRALKVRAAQEGCTMKDLWIKLFTKMLKEQGKPSKVSRRRPAKAGGE
jgi:plasmid stability protein